MVIGLLTVIFIFLILGAYSMYRWGNAVTSGIKTLSLCTTILSAFIIIICCFVINSIRYEANRKDYVTASDGSEYKVIEIDGQPYLKDDCGRITPYIGHKKE